MSKHAGESGAIPIGSYVIRSQYGLNSLSTRDGNMPIIGMKDMVGGKITGANWAMTKIDREQAEDYILRKGDILLNRTNSADRVGKVSIWDREEEAVFASYLVRFEFDAKRTVPAFVNHYLNWDDAQQRLKQISTRGVSQANINPTTFQSHFFVDWPAPPVQRRIAAILDEWDKAIERAEWLVEAKTLSKAGLAVRTFEPCFDDPCADGWLSTALGDLFTERAEAGGSERLLAITGDRGVVDRDETGRKDTSATDKSAYKLIEPGDIGYNTMRMWQGVSALSSLRGLVSPAYTVVRPNSGIDAQYAAQLFKYPHMVHTFWRYSQGLVDDTLMLKFPQFSEIRLNIPPLDTQAAVGEMLREADAEIARLRELCAHLRRQKRGLMQKLLSGAFSVPEGVDRLMPDGDGLQVEFGNGASGQADGACA